MIRYAETSEESTKHTRKALQLCSKLLYTKVRLFFSCTKQLGKMRKEDGSQVWFPSTHAGQLMPVFLAPGHLMPSAGLQRCLHIDVHTPALTERHTHKYISIKIIYHLLLLLLFLILVLKITF